MMWIEFVKPLLKIAGCKIHEFAFEITVDIVWLGLVLDERTVDEDIRDAYLPELGDKDAKVLHELPAGLDRPGLAGNAHDEMGGLQLIERQFILAGRQ